MLSRASPVAPWFATLAVCASGGVRAGFIGPAFASSLSMRPLGGRGTLGARAPSLGALRPATKPRSMSTRPPQYRMQEQQSNRFELMGTVKVIFDEMTFASGFKKREFVVTSFEQYPQEIKFELLKDKCSLIESFKVGDGICVSFNLKGSLWKDDKYFVNLVAWRLQRMEQGDPGEMSGVLKGDYGGWTSGQDAAAGTGFGAFPSQMMGMSAGMGAAGRLPEPMSMPQSQGARAAANGAAHSLGSPRQMGTWDDAALSLPQKGAANPQGWDDDVPF